MIPLMMQKDYNKPQGWRKSQRQVFRLCLLQYLHTGNTGSLCLQWACSWARDCGTLPIMPCTPPLFIAVVLLHFCFCFHVANQNRRKKPLEKESQSRVFVIIQVPYGICRNVMMNVPEGITRTPRTAFALQMSCAKKTGEALIS